MLLTSKVIRREVGSFETQPATHDVTVLTRYNSNIAIFANIHALVITSLHLINFSIFKFFRIDKFSPTSNFLHYFFDMQIFLSFRHSTHNIIWNFIIIFPKFLENFHEVFVSNFLKFLTTFPKFVLIFLQIPPKYS